MMRYYGVGLFHIATSFVWEAAFIVQSERVSSAFTQRQKNGNMQLRHHLFEAKLKGIKLVEPIPDPLALKKKKRKDVQTISKEQISDSSHYIGALMGEISHKVLDVR